MTGLSGITVNGHPSERFRRMYRPRNLFARRSLFKCHSRERGNPGPAL